MPRLWATSFLLQRAKATREDNGQSNGGTRCRSYVLSTSSLSAGMLNTRSDKVHYPSILHFCDMAAGKDYQDINTRWRKDSLRDTALICTTEIDLEGLRMKAKL
jgi:hypothetical protein